MKETISENQRLLAKSRVSKPIFFLVEKFLVNKVEKKPREVLKATWSCLFRWFLAFKPSINIWTVRSEVTREADRSSITLERSKHTSGGKQRSVEHDPSECTHLTSHME